MQQVKRVEGHKMQVRKMIIPRRSFGESRKDTFRYGYMQPRLQNRPVNGWDLKL